MKIKHRRTEKWTCKLLRQKALSVKLKLEWRKQAFGVIQSNEPLELQILIRKSEMLSNHCGIHYQIGVKTNLRLGLHSRLLAQCWSVIWAVGDFYQGELCSEVEMSMIFRRSGSSFYAVLSADIVATIDITHCTLIVRQHCYVPSGLWYIVSASFNAILH